ncbi:hypothetical protein, partial [uncultured Oscillibacter sp.]|uniref:hypothetical protein n=1 Tax=uncultured Oscillibacter sp. TaxID=876091 RepID=UPI00262F279E
IEEKYSNIHRKFLICYAIPKLFFFPFKKVLCFGLHLFPLHKVEKWPKFSVTPMRLYFVPPHPIT